jgi:hypothetical protein
MEMNIDMGTGMATRMDTDNYTGTPILTGTLTRTPALQ